MATDEMPTDRLCTPSGGLPRTTDDEELLLYLYEKSSDSRPKCFDCISMGGLVPMSSETTAGELLSRSTEQICSKTLSLAGPNAAAVTHVSGVVRSCRSQENYYELSDMICVDIDIDENLASSVDALHYRESVVSRTSDLAGSVETVELESGDQSVPEDIKTPDEMVEQSSAEDLSSSSCEPENFTSVIEEPSSAEEQQSSSTLPPTSSDADELDGGDEEGRLNEDAATCFDDESDLQGRTCLKDADRGELQGRTCLKDVLVSRTRTEVNFKDVLVSRTYLSQGRGKGDLQGRTCLKDADRGEL